jgi:hypothetical protein
MHCDPLSRPAPDQAQVATAQAVIILAKLIGPLLAQSVSKPPTQTLAMISQDFNARVAHEAFYPK